MLCTLQSREPFSSLFQIPSPLFAASVQLDRLYSPTHLRFNMATNVPSEAPNIQDQLRPGWLPVLDDMVLNRQDPEEDFPSTLATIYKDYLLSDDDDAPATFARRFDDFYKEVYEPKFNGYNGEKRGWTGYLVAFYETVFSVAVAMDYDEPKQIKVIQLLLELRKLPTHAVKIFVVGFSFIDKHHSLTIL